MVTSSTRGEYSLKDVAELLNTPGSMWSCLLTQFYFPSKLSVLGSDITESFKGANREVAEIAKKVMEKLEEVEKNGLKNVTDMERKGRAR